MVRLKSCRAVPDRVSLQELLLWLQAYDLFYKGQFLIFKNVSFLWGNKDVEMLGNATLSDGHSDAYRGPNKSMTLKE